MRPRELLQQLNRDELPPDLVSRAIGIFRNRSQPVPAASRLLNDMFTVLVREVPDDTECLHRSFPFDPSVSGMAPLAAAELLLPSSRTLRLGVTTGTTPSKIDRRAYYRYTTELILEVDEPMLRDQIGLRVVELFQERVTLHLTRVNDVLRRGPATEFWSGVPNVSTHRGVSSIRVFARAPEHASYEATPPIAAFPDPRVCLHLVRALTRAIEDTRSTLGL